MSVRTALQRSEQQFAIELRVFWAKHKPIVLTLTERCEVQRIEGRVTYVSTTGAYAVVAGWHIPCVDVLGIATPHFSQRETHEGQ